MFPLVTVLVVCFNMVNFGKLAEWQGSGLLTRHSEMGALVRSQYFPPSSRWCNGSTRHSKRLGGSSILSRDASFIGVSKFEI